MQQSCSLGRVPRQTPRVRPKPTGARQHRCGHLRRSSAAARTSYSPPSHALLWVWPQLQSISCCSENRRASPAPRRHRICRRMPGTVLPVLTRLQARTSPGPQTHIHRWCAQLKPDLRGHPPVSRKYAAWAAPTAPKAQHDPQADWSCDITEPRHAGWRLEAGGPGMAQERDRCWAGGCRVAAVDCTLTGPSAPVPFQLTVVGIRSAAPGRSCFSAAPESSAAATYMQPRQFGAKSQV